MRRIGLVVGALGLVASSLAAQRYHRPGLREVRERGSVGLTLHVAEPWGDFKRHGNMAAGLNVTGVSGGSGLGVRLEAAFLTYASDYQGYGASTTSAIGSLGIGPQLTLGGGPLRVYGFATLGGSLFWSSLDRDSCGCYDDDVFFLEGDFTTNRSVGAGLLLNVSSRLALDVGVREVRHDRVTYVPAGGITENSDGSYTVERVETPVGMRVWHAGVSFAIR
ncbi:MAG: hypothetical protein ACREMN_03215 [Gemmatimonadales bacterium]